MLEPVAHPLTATHQFICGESVAAPLLRQTDSDSVLNDIICLICHDGVVFVSTYCTLYYIRTVVTRLRIHLFKSV